MTIPSLHYDVLLALLPFLDSSTLVYYALVCRSLTYPTLRTLWKNPVIHHPDQLLCFIRQLYYSVRLTDSSTSHNNSNNENSRPYHHWIISLTIAFDTFQPIPLLDVFQIFLCHHLPHLMELSLFNTFAVFSPSIRYYHARSCLLEISISALPSSSRQLPPLQLNHSLSSSSNNSSNNANTLWEDLYFGDEPSLPLTRLCITHSSVTLTDIHLRKIASCCPNLEQVQLSGLFTDSGIMYLADHCHGLQQLEIDLPNSFVQANTITQTSMDYLAVSCPLLSRLACLGQTRIDPIQAETTFRVHCPLFTHCDF